jgi:hypothetical protein
MDRAVHLMTRPEVFRMLGFNDPDAMMNFSQRIRTNLDPMVYSYVENGAKRLPPMESIFNPEMTWINMFLYIIITRANLTYRDLGRAVSNLHQADGRIERVIALMLDYVNCPEYWDGHTEMTTAVLKEANMRPNHRVNFDGDDLRCVANLYGFGRVRVMNARNVDMVVAEDLVKEVEEALPPLSLVSIRPKDHQMLFKAFAINRANRNSGNSTYYSVPASDERCAEVIHDYLVATRKLALGEVSLDAMPAIGVYVDWHRRSLIGMIPQPREGHAIDLFKSKLGLDLANVGTAHPQDQAIITVTSLLTVTLMPRTQLNVLH